jgi:hypothetical protein
VQGDKGEPAEPTIEQLHEELGRARNEDMLRLMKEILEKVELPKTANVFTLTVQYFDGFIAVGGVTKREDTEWKTGKQTSEP